MTSVCRVCLTDSKRLVFLKNKLLQNVYEKLSDTKFYSEDARPRALCFLCYQKLQRCHTFSQMAQRSDNILSQLFLKGLQATYEDITELNLGMEQHLSITHTHLTMDDTNTNERSHVPIKVEPMEKEETTEEDPLVQFESVFTENCTKIEIKSEKESDDHGNSLKTDVEQTILDESKKALVSQQRKSFSKYKEKHYNINKHDKKIYITSFVAIPPRTEAGNKLLACHICNKQFNQKVNLIAHMRTHTGEKPYACSLCDKQYSGKTNLVAHMRSHTGEKPFACNACDKRFIQKGVLLRHMTKIHLGAKPFTCHVCKERFYKKHILVDHIMRSHPGEKAFACNVCNKQFDRKNIFVDHMRTHTGEKPFACHVCDKRFNYKKVLEDHIRTHTGEKPFACNVCDKHFSQKSSLAVHMRTHTGDKPFACHVCNTHFNQKDVLIAHIRTHTGEKPFACKVCDKHFNQKRSFVVHMKTHTGQKYTLF